MLFQKEQRNQRERIIKKIIWEIRESGWGTYKNYLYYFYNLFIILKSFQNEKFTYTCTCMDSTHKILFGYIYSSKKKNKLRTRVEMPLDFSMDMRKLNDWFKETNQ